MMSENQFGIHTHFFGRPGATAWIGRPGPPERWRAAGSSRECRGFLRVAAVLGATFALDDVAALLHEPVAALLPVIDELLDAGVIHVQADSFAFCDLGTWRGIVESIPRPALDLLRREAALARHRATPISESRPCPLDDPGPGSAAGGAGAEAGSGPARALSMGPNLVSDTVMLSNLRWDDGSPGEALDLGGEAVQAIDAQTSPYDGLRARLSLAFKLVSLRQTDRAKELIETARREAGPQATPEHASLVDASTAHWLIAQGRLEEAAAAAHSVLRGGGAQGSGEPGRVAHAVLALASLRRGDLAGAQAQARRLRGGPKRAPWHATLYPEWVAFLVAADQAEPGDTLELAETRFPGLLERCNLWYEEPAAGPWLIRAALDGGERRRAEEIAWRVVRLADAPRPAPLLGEIAGLCRALAGADTAGLAHAATRHPDRWSAALAAEHLALLLLGRGEDPGRPRHWLESAQRHFKALGMLRDVQRVHALLKRGGVPRRRGGDPAGAAEPVAPASWADLTEKEREVALLVREGLTNRQISERLYVSPHTVNYHLRRIFEKLGINSRVGLARLTPSAD